MDRSSRGVILGVAVLVVAASLVGCSSDDGGTSAQRSTTTLRASAIALDCPGSSSTATSSLPERCTNAAFLESLTASKVPAAVRKLGEEKQLAFGQGVCAVAHVVATGGSQPPLYYEFVASTAKSWGVSRQVVQVILTNASVLCPQDYLAVANLPRTRGEIEVVLEVGGSGPATVTYTVPDGSSLQESVTAPWSKTLQLGSPIPLVVTARPDGGQALSCVVRVNDENLGTSKRIVEEKAKPAQTVTCNVGADDIGAASAGS